jgi:hypothetical protein
VGATRTNDLGTRRTGVRARQRYSLDQLVFPVRGDIRGMNLDRCDGLQPSWQVAAYGLAGAVTVCKTVGSAYDGSNPSPATTSGNGP